MQVTKLTAVMEPPVVRAHLFTEEQLRNEFDYILAEKFTKNLLEKGLISEGEFNKIMAENCRKFSPFLGEILA
ncbi:MAG: hypothetical protein LUD18_14865 [Lachnospiraceae bacterium]|nr:hypothetical protein [Lachnospiraceae bacterium]